MKIKTPYYIIIVVLLLTALWQSCSTTKHLQEGETLYTGIRKLEVKDPDKSRHGEETMTEVEGALSYPPNGAIFGSSSLRTPFPFRLWIYNAFVNHQDNWFGKWMFNTFAANPVYVSTVNPPTRVKVATNVLHNYGYFSGYVNYDTVRAGKRKAKINYTVMMGKPHSLDSIEYRKFTPVMDSLLKATREERLLKKGDGFSVVNLEGERDRLSVLFRNNGYFYYRPDYTMYTADTLQAPYKVQLRVQPDPAAPENALKQWYVGGLRLNIRKASDTGAYNAAPTDSFIYKRLVITWQGKKPPIKPRALFQNFTFKGREPYSLEKEQSTVQQLNALGVFSQVDFTYHPRDTAATCDTLDLTLNTTLDKPLDGNFAVGVTTKSNDQTGPAVSVGMTRRNIFRGAETFNVSLSGSYEWQTNNETSQSGVSINSYELNLDASLDFPRLFLPKFISRRFRRPATSKLSLNVDWMNRSKYFEMLSIGANIAYSWQPRPYWRHTFTVFSLTYINRMKVTSLFSDLLARNPALQKSMSNQFKPVIGYSFTYDNFADMKRRDHLYWKTDISEAGNIVSLYDRILGHSFASKEKKLFGTPYSQYLKLVSEVRWTRTLSQSSKLATRVKGGVVWAYGNSYTAPYNEQFYVGGANSIRAFTVRSIGPGTFVPGNNLYSYLDQTGSLTFEANAEYRMHLFGHLYGAAFLDIGNIWTLKQDPSRPGSRITLKKFWNQLATGTGAGLRYDMDFIVLRLDVGIGLHLPYDTGKSGYYNLPRFKDGLGIHLAVGYPF